MLVADVYANDLTEMAVKSLIIKLDKAMRDRDEHQLTEILSHDVKVTLQITFFGKKKIKILSRDEYILLVKETWLQYSDYAYTRDDLKVEIRSSEAVVSSVLTEMMSKFGFRIQGKTQEKNTIKWQAGKLVITSMVAMSEYSL